MDAECLPLSDRADEVAPGRRQVGVRRAFGSIQDPVYCHLCERHPRPRRPRRAVSDPQRARRPAVGGPADPAGRPRGGRAAAAGPRCRRAAGGGQRHGAVRAAAAGGGRRDQDGRPGPPGHLPRRVRPGRPVATVRPRRGAGRDAAAALPALRGTRDGAAGGLRGGRRTLRAHLPAGRGRPARGSGRGQGRAGGAVPFRRRPADRASSPSSWSPIWARAPTSARTLVLRHGVDARLPRSADRRRRRLGGSADARRAGLRAAAPEVEWVRELRSTRCGRRWRRAGPTRRCGTSTRCRGNWGRRCRCCHWATSSPAIWRCGNSSAALIGRTAGGGGGRGAGGRAGCVDLSTGHGRAGRGAAGRAGARVLMRGRGAGRSHRRGRPAPALHPGAAGGRRSWCGAGGRSAGRTAKSDGTSGRKIQNPGYCCLRGKDGRPWTPGSPGASGSSATAGRCGRRSPRS